MKQFKDILVLSDNVLLTKAFQKISKEYSSQSFSYAFSPKNKNPKSLISLGAHSLDVSKHSKELIKNYDLIFSLHSKQIFPEELVNSTTCINLHPGLNPYNRGWFPQVFSILNGFPAGATIHLMTNEIDRGPIIDQTLVEIEEWDTSLTAYNKIQKAEIELLNKNLAAIINNDFSTMETLEGNYNSIKDFNMLKEISLNKKGTFKEFIDFLRAMSHPPYKNAYFKTKKGEKVKITIELECDGEEA